MKTKKIEKIQILNHRNIKCLKCGRFCKNIKAKMRYDHIGGEAIDKVEGECSKCGKVDLTKSNWEWEDFDGFEEN